MTFIEKLRKELKKNEKVDSYTALKNQIKDKCLKAAKYGQWCVQINVHDFHTNPAWILDMLKDLGLEKAIEWDLSYFDPNDYIKSRFFLYLKGV